MILVNHIVLPTVIYLLSHQPDNVSFSISDEKNVMADVK